MERESVRRESKREKRDELEGKKKKKARFFLNSHWSEPVPLAQVRTDFEPIRYEIGELLFYLKDFHLVPLHPIFIFILHGTIVIKIRY